MSENNYTPPIKAIRKKCLDCMCGSFEEVKKCTCTNCSLFDYRFGKNPFVKKREFSDEQLEQLRDRIKHARDVRFHEEDDIE